MHVSLPTLRRQLTNIAASDDGIKPWNEKRSFHLPSPLYIAGLGDVHGNIAKAARGIEQWNRVHPRRPIARALQVGDFESIRDVSDLGSVVGPTQYRKLGDYPVFHSGTEVFPVPLHFIGGNHEAHKYLEMFPSGHQLTPNITYGGRVFVSEQFGIKTVGLSGIYRQQIFESGRPNELPVVAGPGAQNWRPWMYFTREEWQLTRDHARGAQILMLHDWPAHLVDLLDPYTIRGTATGKAKLIGNQPALDLLTDVQPDLLICGHHHQFLSGRIYWQTGRMTEVLCLDNFEGEKDVSTRNMAVIEMGEQGLRVLHGDISKEQTPELLSLRDTMTSQDKEFSYALYAGQEIDFIKAIIARINRRIVWNENSFVMGGFRFTLRENSETAFTADLDADPTYLLTVEPVIDARQLSPQRVISMATQILLELRNKFRVEILSSFNDQI